MSEDMEDDGARAIWNALREKPLPLGPSDMRAAFRAALAVVRKAEGWQPIETAPRDGTIIDLWSPDHGVIHDEWWDDGWCSGLPYAAYTHWRRDRAPDGSFAIETPPEAE